MEHQNKPKVLKWSLIIGITIVLNMFFNYALSVAYKAPEYTDFCKNTQVIEQISTQEQCIAIGGQWNANVYTPEPKTIGVKPVTGYCDPDYTCRQNYEAAQTTYDRNVFVTLIALGVLVLALSFVFSNEAISKGLALGGVLSFVIASMRYWGRADDYIKVIILGVALVALIYLAYKKFGSKN